MYRQELNVWQCCVKERKSLLYMTTADHARTLCHVSADCEPSRIMSVFVSTSEQECKLCTPQCSTQASPRWPLLQNVAWCSCTPVNLILFTHITIVLPAQSHYS